MEHFRNAKVVRLLSRHDKYLTADDDDEDGVRQHRSGASRGAKWEVELVEGRANVIRLKSCFNRYLAASDKRVLLGATGRKVVLLPLPPKAQPQSLGESVEWQPVRDGTKFVKLRTKSGTFLRANGFVKPSGNTVTHGNPHRTATQDWVLWEVDIVGMGHDSTAADHPPPVVCDVIAPPSPFPPVPPTPDRKKDQHLQSRSFSTGKLLAVLASVTGAHSRRSSSAISEVSVSSCLTEEEDAGSTPSPRSSAFDSPKRPMRLRTSSTEMTPVTATQQSSVDTMSTVSSTSVSTSVTSPSRRTPSPTSSPPRRPSTRGSTPPRNVSTPVSSPPRRMPTHGSSPPRRMPDIVSPSLSSKQTLGGGRLVQYYFADDDGGVDDSFDCGSFEFHGDTAQELIHRVEKETDIDGFILCTRNVINGKLCRLKLDVALPPNRAPMTVFVVHPMSNG